MILWLRYSGSTPEAGTSLFSEIDLASIRHTYVNASISLTYVNIEKCWFFLEIEIIFALSFSEQMRRQVYMDQRGQAKGKLTRKLLAESSSHILEKIKT